MDQLKIIKGENFENIFKYTQRKNDQEYDIDISTYDIVFEVIDPATGLQILVEDTDFSLSRSVKNKGIIILDMLATQTDALDDDLSLGFYTLYIEDVTNDKRKLLKQGYIQFLNWTRLP